MHKWESNDMGLMAKINTTREQNVDPNYSHDDDDVTCKILTWKYSR